MENASIPVVLEQASPQPLPARRAANLGLVEASPPGVRAKRLYEEARAASLAHLHALEQAIAEVKSLTETVVECGDLYGPGVTAFASQLGDDLFWRAKSLALLIHRQPR
jgi:hypothetical protein